MQRKIFKKKAFTLIELLIVIAIIGILFIVLVSKVDFATDKAKATGVQTTFRSYQMAFETVSRENAGFNTFGWNTGDNAGAIPAGYAFVDDAAKNATIGDGIRNSYDEGDKNLNGTADTGEVFTGRKIYTETWTNVYSLTKPGTTGLDAVALAKLETAINANLDPALHITINTDGTISMANGMKDPWNKEYHGWYITNAEVDKKDRGAIIMYSDGPNNEFGSEHTIANGVVTITIPNSNKNGKDDYALVSCYTFTNGYGETKTITSGFSNNQNLLAGSGAKPGVDTPDLPNVNNEYEMLDGSNQVVDGTEDVVLRSAADFDKFDHVEVDDVLVDESNYTVTEGSTVVNLKKEYIQTLSYGAHVVKIVSDDGKASANIYFEEKVSMEQLSTGKFKMFDGSGMSFAIVNGGVELYNNNSVVATLPSELVTINNNVVTITGTGTYDGTYTICEDGYVELNGQIVAKSEQMWVDVEPGTYIVVHNGIAYISNDGNTIIEEYIKLEDLGSAVNNFLANDDMYAGYPYQFDAYNGVVTVGTVYDAIAVQTLTEKAWFQWLFTGVYKYWGGTAYDEKDNTSLITHAHWDETDVDAIIKFNLCLVQKSGTFELATSTIISDGIYTLKESQTYFHDGHVTENIMFFEDYPLYFEDGMTYRDWIHKYFIYTMHDTCNGYCEHRGLYIPQEYLDLPCEPGYNSHLRGWWEMGSDDGFIRSDDIGYIDSNGNFVSEPLVYTDGKKYVKPAVKNYDECYKYIGRVWDGGIIENQFYADEFFNYYIENGLSVPSHVTLDPVLKVTNGTPVIDISEFLSYSDNTLYVNAEGIMEKYGVDQNVTVLPIRQLGEYYVDCTSRYCPDYAYSLYWTTIGNGSADGVTGITFYYNGVVYTGFAN